MLYIQVKILFILSNRVKKIQNVCIRDALARDVNESLFLLSADVECVKPSCLIDNFIDPETGNTSATRRKNSRGFVTDSFTPMITFTHDATSFFFSIELEEVFVVQFFSFV